MSYELIQDLLTDAAIATLIAALALPVLHAFTRTAAIATPDQPVTPAEPEIEEAPLFPTEPYLAAVPPVEPAEWTEGDRAQFHTYLEALPEQPVLRSMKVAELRTECDRLGIRWNRAAVGANGKLRHLNKGELERAIALAAKAA